VGVSDVAELAPAPDEQQVPERELDAFPSRGLKPGPRVSGANRV
jgi:hypothetical protein